MYQYIIEVEMMMFMRYKVQYVEIEDKMTMIDLQSFMNILKFKKEQDEKDQGGDKVMKSLAAIRDILNYMFVGDSNLR